MKWALLSLSLVPYCAFAQGSNPFTTGNDVGKSASAAPVPGVESLLTNLKARSLGPTSMGGRVTDIAVYEKEPRIFFIGSASGGVWKTENGGMTFAPVFYKEATSNIGAVTVSQSDPNLVWVGTGEGTSRNSAGWGSGIYKSTDGGKTWAFMGLPNSYHIAKIVIDPKNNNIVFAAVQGALWGYNADRGAYKTTDAGKTWKKVLYVDEKTGATDLVMDPSNDKVLLAGMWQRLRKSYDFTSGGPSSGMYRSTDGGNTWSKVTKGLPTDPVGRIGLSFFRKDPRMVIATVENPKSGGTFRSTDGGASWKNISRLDPRPFYFSVPRQDPLDLNRVYVPAVSLHYSTDGGQNFTAMRTTVHVDHHAMWIDPSDSNHMIIGEDGGVGQTRDRGATWEHLNYLNIGQYYAVAFDMRKPYWVYGGLQDNGSWAGPTQTTHGGVAFFDFYGIGGGDGFHVQVDPEDWTTVYSESQGGAVQRIDQKYGSGRFIAPRSPNAADTYRFNWSTPIELSPFNSKTIYVGGNKLFKSVDRGDHWKAISPDLSLNLKEEQTPGKGSVSPEDTGAERHNTIITISESPMRAGVIWAGTDDGQVQLTQDDGATWTNLTKNVPGVPAETWVSRITASKYVEGRAYLTFDGHRSNDYKTYVFETEDYGKTWKSINANLPPNEPCYVIKEGLKNPDLLFLGTEYSLYVSLDRGQNWARYRSGDWPTVPVHDVVIHPREEDLVIGTHGRSIWILPIEALEEMTRENMQKDAVLTKPQAIYLFGREAGGQWDGDRVFVSANTQPGTQFTYYLRANAPGDIKIAVTDPAGNPIADLTGPGKAGINSVTWGGRARGRVLAPGDYRVVLTVSGKDYYNTLHVEDVTDQQMASPPRITSNESQEMLRQQREEQRREEEEEGNGK